MSAVLAENFRGHNIVATLHWGEHDVISILLECTRLCSLHGPGLRIEPFAPGGVNTKSTFTRLSVCCGNPQFCKMTSGKPKHSAPNIVPHKDKKTSIHPVVTKRLGLPSHASLHAHERLVQELQKFWSHTLAFLGTVLL